jgi:hypothetical protein
MKIWFNKNFSSIAFVLEQLKKHSKINTLYSHTHWVDYQHFADAFILEPEQTSDYVNFCLTVCQQYQIDVFYPWREFAQLYLQKQAFEKLGIQVIFPCSAENFVLIDNKACFYQHLIAKNSAVNLPLFKVAATKAEFIAYYQALKTQTERVCMKPAVSVYGAGFKVIHDAPDYEAWQALIYGKDRFHISYQSLIDLLPLQFKKPVLLLDFLPGDEYSHDILCAQGKIIAGTIRQKLNSTDKYQCLIQQPEIERMSQLLVAEFALSGFINIQYRDDKDKQPFLLEINPRISGGFPKISLAGIDYVNLLVKLLTKQPILPIDTVQKHNVKVGSETVYRQIL